MYPFENGFAAAAAIVVVVAVCAAAAVGDRSAVRLCCVLADAGRVPPFSFL